MVSRSNAWWMTKTKGIYIFSISPFRQRALAGFPTEIANLAKLHWKGVLYASSLCVGAYSLLKWANHAYHESLRKENQVPESTEK